jgi:hypothetical protein
VAARPLALAERATRTPGTTLSQLALACAWTPDTSGCGGTSRCGTRPCWRLLTRERAAPGKRWGTQGPRQSSTLFGAVS